MFNIIRRSAGIGSFQEGKRELLGVLLQFKKTFFFLGFISFIINLLMLLPAIYMFQIYDRVLMSRNIDTLIMLTIIVVALFVILALLEWARSQVMIRMGNSIEERMSSRLFAAAFQKVLRTGTANASQPFNDFTNIRQFITGNGLFAFFDAPWTPIYIIVIFLIHPILGVFSIVSAVILLALAIANELVTRKPLAEANKLNIVSTTFAGSNFRNAEAIEAMGMLGNVKKKWFPLHEAFLKLQAKASENASAISATTKFARITFQSLILGVGAYLAVKNTITPGGMIAASILMGRALAPVDLAIATWKQFVSARTSYNRLEELLNTFPEPPQSMPLPPPVGNVTVTNLVAVPPGTNRQVLAGVNFHVQAGEIVAIIGPSASGKSTLARLLVGVWKPYIGNVRLDGADISNWNKEELGNYIGYLPQDIELLDGTIAENIARFGEVDSEKVIKAAKTAGIHEMILQFPLGYDTPIGAGGIFLSGGQRQRIALARAIYGEPPLIVLDEPNSNLDDLGEIALVQALLKLKESGKTIFVITHRTSILSVVDKILVLANGTMRLFGPKNDVLTALQQAQQQIQQQQQAQQQVQQQAQRQVQQQQAEGQGTQPQPQT